MDRAGTAAMVLRRLNHAASSRHPSWRLIALACYVALNLVLIPQTVRLGPAATDWQLFSMLPSALTSGTVYDVTSSGVWFAWSPVMALMMAGVSIAGYWSWVAAHLAALALLKDWRLIALLLVSWGFWFDVAQGNTVTFVVVAGALALRGSRPAALAYVGLCLLMPRPIQLPLLTWLLWQDRSLWRPSMAMFVLHGTAVLLSGYAADWLGVLTHTVTVPWDMGPVSAIGPAWFAIGIPLAILLTRRRHVGWAGLAISPYIVPQYLIMPLVERGRDRRVHPDARTSARVDSSE